MDLLVGHRLVKGRPQRAYLQTGDTVDSWKVIIVEPEKQLALLFGMKAPGLGRLCFTLKDKGDHRELDVRAWWHPHGMPGLFYWLFMIPAHLFIFRGRRGDQIKVLWADSDGLCLFTKRLERGRFVWPVTRDGKVHLTPAQLSMLLEGINWKHPKRTERAGIRI